ncbi:hypothetical protein OH76DRAFT_1366742, partial [Lentinus brumalis]
LNIYYESKVDWRTSSDILRAHPEFHDRPRYDGILYSTTKGPVFGELLCLLVSKIGGKEYPLALVHPYDAALARRPSAMDKALGFFPVRAQPRSRAGFIPVDSIIRGAVLVPDFDSSAYFLVHDLVDGDMFFRIKELRS